MNGTKMMLKECELTERGIEIPHWRCASMRSFGETVVPARRWIEGLRPALASILVRRPRPNPREEARHA